MMSPTARFIEVINKPSAIIAMPKEYHTIWNSLYGQNLVIVTLLSPNYIPY